VSADLASIQVGRNMAKVLLQDLPRMLNEWNPVRLIWLSWGHILYIPKVGSGDANVALL
jgi:hypothetical protein